MNWFKFKNPFNSVAEDLQPPPTPPEPSVTADATTDASVPLLSNVVASNVKDDGYFGGPSVPLSPYATNPVIQPFSVTSGMTITATVLGSGGGGGSNFWGNTGTTAVRYTTNGAVPSAYSGTIPDVMLLFPMLMQKLQKQGLNPTSMYLTESNNFTGVDEIKVQLHFTADDIARLTEILLGYERSTGGNPLPKTYLEMLKTMVANLTPVEQVPTPKPSSATPERAKAILDEIKDI